MSALVRFGLRQRLLLHTLFVGLLAATLGIVLPRIPIERYPNIDFGEAVIVVAWPGASAEEVERLVVRPLEDAIRGVEHLEFVRATARDGFCEFSIKFEDDRDYPRLFDDLRLRVLAAQPRLPVHNGRPLQPVVTRLETDAWLPVIQANLIPDDPERLDLHRLGQLAQSLADRLAPIPGMKRVEVEGAPEVRAEVVLDPTALERHGVTIEQVAAALRAAGQAPPAGESRAGGVARTLIADARYRDLADVWAVAVRVEGDGRLLTVGDLADRAASGIRPVEGGLRVHCNGRPTVAVKALKAADARAPEIRARVRAEVEAFLAEHAEEGVQVVYTLDAVERVAATLAVLVAALVQGSLLVLLVLCACFGWRTALLAVGGVLIACMAAVAAMHGLGQSLNEITLLALVLMAGVLTDDVIVVLDNVRRRREEGEPLLEAIVAGTDEVLWPLVAAVTTTLASFLPLLLMSGTTGDFFRLLPVTVVIALVMSLAECLLLTPAHIADLERWCGPERVPPPAGAGVARYLGHPGLAGRLARAYDRLLLATLAHPWRTLAAAGALLLLALGILVQSALAPGLGWRPLLRLAFFPEDIHVVNVTLRAPAGTPLAETDQLARAIAAELAADPGVRAVAGISGMYIDPAYRPVWGQHHAVLFAELPLARGDLDALAVVGSLRKRLEARWQRDGLEVQVSPQKDGPPTDAPLVARLSADTHEAAARAARALRQYLERAAADGALPGLVDIADDTVWGQRLRYRPDPERCALLGVSPARAVAAAAAANGGAHAGELRLSDRDAPLVVRLPPAVSEDPAQLGELPLVLGPEGRRIVLTDLGRFAIEEEPLQRVRRDHRPTVTVRADLARDSPLSAPHLVAAAERWWREAQHAHPGVALAFGGEAEATARSLRSLAVSFAVAVFAVWCILIMQFRELRAALLVMASIISAFVGVTVMMGLLGAAALLLPEGAVRPERAMFTVQTFVAMVGLAGMVVNEGIILLSFVISRRAEGLDLDAALRLAGHQRLRPILMATLTTIAGMLPMAIGIPHFSIAWSPMATAFIAGLTMSTLLSLLVLPPAYRLLAPRDEARPRAP